MRKLQLGDYSFRPHTEEVTRLLAPLTSAKYLQILCLFIDMTDQQRTTSFGKLGTSSTIKTGFYNKNF